MSFEENLQRYAELLATHAVNVQPGQVVHIGTEVCNRDFALKVAEAMYQRGAKHVDVDLVDPRFTRARLQTARDEDLGYAPAFITTRTDDIVEGRGGTLRIIGSEDPDVLSDLDPQKLNVSRLATRKRMDRFYDEGIGKSLVHWSVAAAATPAWGKKIFPDLDPETACARLWDEIFRMSRADQPNCLELWQAHNDALQSRARKLTSMKVDELHFTGPGTDLVVGLSPIAIFKGGSEAGPHGVAFEPNIPTEEVFTTPDYRKTHGHVRATRPFYINGRLIEGLEIVFEGGKIVDFSASQGKETFQAYIDSDEGGRRLGEVALVGIDSPIYQSGLVFQEILFDENAACHIAVGSAYKTCLENGENLSSDELANVGCNESVVHTDMMISSEEVDVTAKTRDGDSIALISKGEWAADLLSS